MKKITYKMSLQQQQQQLLSMSFHLNLSELFLLWNVSLRKKEKVKEFE